MLRLLQLNGGLKDMIQKVIVLPNGRRVTLGTYVQDWRRLLTLDPSREVGGFEWYPMPARHILRAISQGVHDRINTRGRVTWGKRDAGAKLASRIRAGRLERSCKWCGAVFCPSCVAERFCDFSCRVAHNS